MHHGTSVYSLISVALYIYTLYYSHTDVYMHLTVQRQRQVYIYIYVEATAQLLDNSVYHRNRQLPRAELSDLHCDTDSSRIQPCTVQARQTTGYTELLQ